MGPAIYLTKSPGPSACPEPSGSVSVLLTKVSPMTETAAVEPVGTIAMFTIDCLDANVLAAFYASLLGMELAYSDDNVAMLTGPNGPALGFGGEPNYTPPPWPDDNCDKQFHLDLKVADIPAAEQASLALGATRPDFQPGGDRWRVLLDPAGHPFCLTLWST